MRTKEEYNKYMRGYLKARYKTDKDFRETERKRTREKNRELKKLVLSHYGKQKKLMCTWRNCFIDDLDMLSIDHKYNNGAEHREQLTKGKRRTGGGLNMYSWLKVHGFPEGFRTLCHNHQWKKEILRRKVQ